MGPVESTGRKSSNVVTAHPGELVTVGSLETPSADSTTRIDPLRLYVTLKSPVAALQIRRNSTNVKSRPSCRYR